MKDTIPLINTTLLQCTLKLLLLYIMTKCLSTYSSTIFQSYLCLCLSSFSFLYLIIIYKLKFKYKILNSLIYKMCLYLISCGLFSVNDLLSFVYSKYYNVINNKVNLGIKGFIVIFVLNNMFMIDLWTSYQMYLQGYYDDISSDNDNNNSKHNITINGNKHNNDNINNNSKHNITINGNNITSNKNINNSKHNITINGNKHNNNKIKKEFLIKNRIAERIGNVLQILLLKVSDIIISYIISISSFNKNTISENNIKFITRTILTLITGTIFIFLYLTSNNNINNKNNKNINTKNNKNINNKNNNNINTENIINNKNKNTENIINNKNKNTENIINNKNKNTENIINNNENSKNINNENNKNKNNNEKKQVSILIPNIPIILLYTLLLIINSFQTFYTFSTQHLYIYYNINESAFLNIKICGVFFELFFSFLLYWFFKLYKKNYEFGLIICLGFQSLISLFIVLKKEMGIFLIIGLEVLFRCACTLQSVCFSPLIVMMCERVIIEGGDDNKNGDGVSKCLSKEVDKENLPTFMPNVAGIGCSSVSISVDSINNSHLHQSPTPTRPSPSVEKASPSLISASADIMIGVSKSASVATTDNKLSVENIPINRCDSPSSSLLFTSVDNKEGSVATTDNKSSVGYTLKLLEFLRGLTIFVFSNILIGIIAFISLDKTIVSHNRESWFSLFKNFLCFQILGLFLGLLFILTLKKRKIVKP
ncbi:hypothetical protein CDIK_0767 [Cucumispora dikerogammari]|nr:hypothetical protein CDIK_0767 [Cucumispora dikerogammari]